MNDWEALEKFVNAGYEVVFKKVKENEISCLVKKPKHLIDRGDGSFRTLTASTAREALEKSFFVEISFNKKLNPQE